MYQHISETSKIVFQLAKEKSEFQGLDYIKTEHILLGILGHGMGMGAQMLDRFGVTFSVVEKMAHDFAGKSKNDTWVFGKPPGTVDFQRIIAIAMEEAESYNSRKVGTEFLILAMLREKGCMAEKILSRLAVTYNGAREMTAELLGRKTPYPISKFKKV